jgi:ketosteroid isomerase-like protein
LGNLTNCPTFNQGERPISNQREFTERFFAAVMAKDMNAVLGFFAEDAELIDPHYPKMHMKGKAAIRADSSLIYGKE